MQSPTPDPPPPDTARRWRWLPDDLPIVPTLRWLVGNEIDHYVVTHGEPGLRLLISDDGYAALLRDLGGCAMTTTPDPACDDYTSALRKEVWQIADEPPAPAHDDDTPRPVAIRAELAQSLDNYRRAFVAWAVAACAVEVEGMAGHDRFRLDRLRAEQEAARWRRDDCHIRLVAELFISAEGEDDDA